jgi:hypothetical protein
MERDSHSTKGKRVMVQPECYFLGLVPNVNHEMAFVLSVQEFRQGRTKRIDPFLHLDVGFEIPQNGVSNCGAIPNDPPPKRPDHPGPATQSL